ncbi:MAG: hypothetical protein ACLQNE_35200 [Thermoguttaceae bacterium]
MLPDEIEDLKTHWTDQYVAVTGGRPELARFAHLVGQVKTVNMSGRALVQFDGDGNRSWYDIHPAFLKIVEKPAPKVVEKPAKAAAKAAAKNAEK